MGFDAYAQNWDTDKRIDRARIIANEIGNSLDMDKVHTAMEFGCGTGLISFNLHDRFREITLVDSSEGMIDILRAKIHRHQIDNMIPVHGTVNENLTNKKFDVIYSSMVLHHIHDIPAIVKYFYDLLRNDGYLCIVDLNEEDDSFHKEYPDFDGHNGFNQEELSKALVRAGFDNIESNTFFLDEKTIEDTRIDYSLFLMKARKYCNTSLME
ncbi:class I SAM-dependent DNA methyltransferase [Anaerosolibacter sp.]|uniref:class I SAM-dependent DNA methyltransferase n=1 Tax=Anaerosolibacter sp. TaxID=1872527 RepID=UPI0039EFE601